MQQQVAIHLPGLTLPAASCTAQPVLKLPAYELATCFHETTNHVWQQAVVLTTLQNVMQGLSRLTMVLQQFGIAAAALGSVHMLEAATVFPPITRIAAFLFISVSGQPLSR